MDRLRDKFRSAFNKYSAPRWMVLMADSLAVFISFFIASMLRYSLASANLNFERSSRQALIVLGVYLISFLIFKSYRGLIRHTTIKDTFTIFITNSFALMTLLLIGTFARQLQLNPVLNLPFSVLIIHYGMITVIMFFERVMIKMVYEFMFSSSINKKSAFIFGAGEMGMIVKDAIQKDRSNNIKVIGFLDDKKKLHGKNMSGVGVLPTQRLTIDLVKKHKLKVLIFAVNVISPKRKSEIITKALELGLELLDTPPFENWLNGQIQVKQLQKVKLKDLLGREPIDLDMAKIQKELEGKVIMVTGAAGSIGSEIVRQLMKFRVKKLVLIDNAETPVFHLINELKESFVYANIEMIISDVTNHRRMNQLFNLYKPDIVFHAAAYKHVPVMEDSPCEAFRVNVGGTKVVADLAHDHEVDKFVMISSDKAVNPTNVMGATKRICELYIQSVAQKNHTNTQYVTTRFGNVLGSNGSVIPLFQKQLEKGGPLTITHPDMERYFMTIPEACQLVLEAGFMGKGGEIFVFDMGEPVKILDLSRQMIKLSGLTPDVDIKIMFTGLRPGEKLFEELLSDEENTKPTHHPKILIADVRKTDHHTVLESIDSILIDLYSLSKAELVQRFKDLVPEYQNSNSVLKPQKDSEAVDFKEVKKPASFNS